MSKRKKNVKQKGKVRGENNHKKENQIRHLTQNFLTGIICSDIVISWSDCR